MGGLFGGGGDTSTPAAVTTTTDQLSVPYGGGTANEYYATATPSGATNGYPMYGTSAGAQEGRFINPPTNNPPTDAGQSVASTQSTAGGGGVPSSIQPTPEMIASLAPASISAFGATPSVAPSYMSAVTTNPYEAFVGYNPAQESYGTAYMGPGAATVNPNQSQQYLNQAENALYTSLAPGFEQQTQNLQDQLAQRGISNSGAAGQLMGNLQGQQAAALASGIEPMVSQGYGYSQADIAANQANQQAVNQARYASLQNIGATNTANTQAANQAAYTAAQGYIGGNTAAENAANQYNATAANSAAVQNANYYQQALNTNFGAYNNYLSQLYGTGSAQANALENAYLGTYAPQQAIQGEISGASGQTGGSFNTGYQSAIAQQNAAIQGAFSAAGAAFGVPPGLGSAAPEQATMPLENMATTGAANIEAPKGYTYNTTSW